LCEQRSNQRLDKDSLDEYTRLASRRSGNLRPAPTTMTLEGMLIRCVFEKGRKEGRERWSE